MGKGVVNIYIYIYIFYRFSPETLWTEVVYFLLLSACLKRTAEVGRPGRKTEFIIRNSLPQRL
jgi:hypothetical protein